MASKEKEHLKHARRLNHHSHSMQGDHNTMQDWRKAQPPLSIQCKEITTPGTVVSIVFLVCDCGGVHGGLSCRKWCFLTYHVVVCTRFCYQSTNTIFCLSTKDNAILF